MASKKTAGRVKVVLAFLLLFCPAFLLILISTRSCEHKFEKLPDYGKIEAYSFIDATGKKRSSTEFRNDIVLITTLQATCPNDCSISLSNLKLQIFQLINGRKGMKIISFVTDAEGNPVDDLTATQQMLQDEVLNYDPKYWILAKGDAKKIYDIRKGNHSLLEDLKKEGIDGGDYTSLLLLIDRSNHLRMIRQGNSEGQIRQMKQLMALLKKEYDLKEYEETH